MPVILSKGRWIAATLACALGLILVQVFLPDFAPAAFMLVIANGIILALWRTPRGTNPLPNLSVRQGMGALRTPLAILCLVGALLLFVRFGEFFLSPFIILASFLLVGAALWLKPFPLPAFTSRVGETHYPLHIPFIIVGALLLWLFAEISGNWLHIALLSSVSVHIQILLLGAGIVLVVWGLGGRLRWPVIERREILILGAITLLALFLRLLVVDTAIPRFVDEMNFVDAIVRLWDTPTTPLLVPFGRIATFSWVFSYFQAHIANVVGHTLFGLRATSAIFGTITVLALYFLSRVLFNRKIAVLAALLLTTFPAHLQFSRIALNNIADPLFATLALAFLARGIKHHRRADYVVAGALLGLTQYFYEGGRLLYPGLLVAWLGFCWLVGPHRRERAVNGVFLLLTALLVAFPVYYTLSAVGTFTPRFDDVSMLPTSPAAFTPENTMIRYFPWMMYTVLPDMSWFYGGSQPMVLNALAPFFLLGVAFALWRVRSLPNLLVILWIAFTSFGNMLLVETAMMPRYVVVFPAVALLLALGITYLLESFWPAGLKDKWRTSLLVSLVVLASVGQTVYYFRDYLPYFNNQFISTSQSDEALLRSLNLPAGTRVHIILPQAVWEFNINSFIRFWQPNVSIDARFPVQVTPEFLKELAQNPDAAHAFFIKASDQDTLDKIKQYFVLTPPEYSPYDDKLVTHMVLYYGYAR